MHSTLLQDLIEKNFPENVRTFSIGDSINGQDLKGIRMSSGLRGFEGNSTIELRPMVKLVANVHGNEPTGRELLIQVRENSIKLIFYFKMRKSALSDYC